MNDEDRQKIIQNLVELVEETNLHVLVPELCQRAVFTAGMIQKYMVSCLFNVNKASDVVCACNGCIQ
jgi:hypothetical protein